MYTRISPEVVVNAMKTLGLNVARGDYYDYYEPDDESKPTCACGLGALAVSQGMVGYQYASNLDEEVGYGYSMGFIDGFDGLPSRGTLSEYKGTKYDEGYPDGQAAYAKCVEDGLKDVTDDYDKKRLEERKKMYEEWVENGVGAWEEL